MDSHGLLSTTMYMLARLDSTRLVSTLSPSLARIPHLPSNSSTSTVLSRQCAKTRTIISHAQIEVSLFVARESWEGRT